ncbi:glycerate kinase [Leucobacter sp. UT-8R-CII-1-4]|uniref:glycerate kinase n=1 Tax=Leucobacter sp. UT-8R-CII-1-4 TaxID=3040075 RepID=UPI0024A9331A|nr:glycerate kinase [Leucobacter sp. UT-8R-CII-1-4]MDI6022840.1 glycerate kinase [Leucobacter sp. UT-8R-CII-1-4]
MSNAAPIIVIAPDSLKGSCSSPEAAAAIARGVRQVFGDSVEVREVPMADGGEGTLDALVAAWRGNIARVPTTDALGQAIEGRVGLGDAPNGALLAIIETADANGLPAVSDRPLRPLDADTAGVGTLLRAALDAGASELLLCLGGSATSDGGAGMLRELGAQLLTDRGESIAPGARGLLELHRIDLWNLDERAKSASWRIACDVDNPLTGSRGAAAVFAPQKGANKAEVELIDRALNRLADVLAETIGLDCAALKQQAGIGAAGGLALGLSALFGAELVPGSQLVSAAVGLPAALEGATLVFTGEGRFDSQSLDGKVVSQVLSDAASESTVIVLAGSVDLTPAQTREAGVSAAFSIARGPAALADMQLNAETLLEATAAQVCGAILAAKNLSRV